MKKFYLSLLVLILLSVSCKQPVQNTGDEFIKRESWDKDFIYYLNNATDEEVLSHADEGVIYDRLFYTYEETGLNCYFQNYKTDNSGWFDRYIIAFKYEENYVSPTFIKTYSYPYQYYEKTRILKEGSFTLSKENGNYYFTVDNEKKRYLVSEHYLYIFE